MGGVSYRLKARRPGSDTSVQRGGSPPVNHINLDRDGFEESTGHKNDYHSSLRSQKPLGTINGGSGSLLSMQRTSDIR